MPTYRIVKITTRESAGGPSAIEVTAELEETTTLAHSVTVTNVDKVDMTSPTTINDALADANADIDFTL